MGVESTERSPRRRGPTYDRSTIDRAEDMRRLGDSYRVIGATLAVPVTTVQYWTQHVVTDKSGRWGLADVARRTEPDPNIVLAELGAVTASSGGKVTGMTQDEARWVTAIARARPDILNDAPGSTWQEARRFIEALSAGDEAKVLRLEQGLAEGAFVTRWPGRREQIAALREKARQASAAIQAGANPFLDGRPNWPQEDER
jgi:hypothetical protein